MPANLPTDPAPVTLYKSVLPDMAVYEFALTPLDHLGVPAWCTAQWLPSGSLITGNGYGFEDGAARTGSYGEMTEGFYAWQLTEMPRRTASFQQLSTEAVACLDPLRDRLPVTTNYTPDRPLEWVAARTYPANEEVLVPLEAVAIGKGKMAYDWLYTPISNGLGAGESRERAIAHGLLELLQRDGNAISYRALDQGIRIELDEVQNPETCALLERYEQAGLEIQVKLASSDFGITSLYVVGYERDISRVPHPIMLTGCGEAAHPDREVALAKALLEFASSRVRKRFAHGPLDPLETLAPDYITEIRKHPPRFADQEPRAAHAMRDWTLLGAAELFGLLKEKVFSVTQTVKFSELPTVPLNSLPTPADVLEFTVGRLREAGLQVYYVPMTAPHDPVQAVKVIVPELEVETMTYDRIGSRNVRKLLARHSPLVGFGTPPAGAFRVPLPAAEEAQFGGPVWFSPEQAQATVGNLYALYREPARHSLHF